MGWRIRILPGRHPLRLELGQAPDCVTETQGDPSGWCSRLVLAEARRGCLLAAPDGVRILPVPGSWLVLETPCWIGKESWQLPLLLAASFQNRSWARLQSERSPQHLLQREKRTRAVLLHYVVID